MRSFIAIAFGYRHVPAISREQLSFDRNYSVPLRAGCPPEERRGSFARRLSPFLLPFSPFVRLFQLSDPLARPVATQRTTRPAFDHRREPGRILSLVRSCASLSLSLAPSVFCPTLSNAHKCARNACTCPDTLNGARPFYSPRSVPLPERLPLSS